MAHSSDYPPEFTSVTENNKKACKCLADAQKAFLHEDFELALRYLDGYRYLVNYSKFPCHNGSSAESKSASVVIVAFNTSDELITCINSLLSDNMEDKEIIVVDNGGNSDVLNILLSMPVLYVKAPVNLFPSEGRNIGAALASSPVLVFIDDDAVATPSFCLNAHAAFEDSSVLAVMGQAIPKTQNARNTSAIAHRSHGDTPRRARITLECVSAWRRAEYLEVGGMDPLLFGHEGEELSLRLLDNYPEAQLLYCPNLVVYHDLADSEADHQGKMARHKKMSLYFNWKRRRHLHLSRLAARTSLS